MHENSLWEERSYIHIHSKNTLSQYLGKKRKPENTVRTGKWVSHYNPKSNNSRINSGLKDRQRCPLHTSLS